MRSRWASRNWYTSGVLVGAMLGHGGPKTSLAIAAVVSQVICLYSACTVAHQQHGCDCLHGPNYVLSHAPISSKLTLSQHNAQH